MISVRATLTGYLLLAAVIAQASACTPRAFSEAGRPQARAQIESVVLKQVVEAAIDQTGYTFTYDPSYVKLDYPGGDIPLDRGVCSDVVVRAFRKGGVDLQKEIHEDMRRNFSSYPKRWKLAGPDPNIDHRRVANLMTFFERKGKALAVTDEATNYRPGDVVAWDLGGGLLHIGIVTNIPAARAGRYKIVHNIGAGAKLEDALFSWQIIGHYRFF